MCRHITLLLPNRSGEFYRIAAILGEENVNIIGYLLASEGHFGILHLLCDDHLRAFTVLKAHYKFYCSDREVIVVRLRNTPGELGRVLQILSNNSINLPNSYQIAASQGSAHVVLEFDQQQDLRVVCDLFIAAGITIISSQRQIE